MKRLALFALIVCLIAGLPTTAKAWIWENTAALSGATRANCVIEVPPNMIFAGTEGGANVYRSIDGGNSWTSWTLSGVTGVNCLLYSAGFIFAGTTGGSNVYYTNPGVASWTACTLTGPSAVNCLVETGGLVYAGTTGGSNVYSKPIGLTCTWTPRTLAGGVSTVYSLLGGSNGLIFAGTGPSGDVWATGDGGSSWGDTELSGPSAVYTLLEASAGFIYAGTGPAGDVYRRYIGGGDWTAMADISGATYVYDLLEVGGWLYAGSAPNGDVHRSNDWGTSNWLSTSNLSGATEVRDLVQVTDGNLYAGTFPSGAVFKTDQPPSVVTMTRFSAKPLLSKVLLEWETVAEVDNAGFHVLRADEEQGEFEQITPQLIPSLGSAGGSYEFFDEVVEAGISYYYKLEALDIYGNAELHGPVEATAGQICAANVVREGGGAVNLALLLLVPGLLWLAARRMRRG